MAVRRVPAGRPQVEEVVDGVAAQLCERAVKRGWRCRLLVREPNLILPNIREANVEGMKEKWLQVIGVLERGLDKHGPAEEGRAVQHAWQQVTGMLEALLEEQGQRL
ncbi:---NA--- [Pelobates cultripes]|uniref:---NA n=1 Tax=Pelobates cultripes TaxID=61616 RepID=A0AAD1TC38_PELCU|nr:---NA--- [Pelobates cultripes]